MSYFDDFASDYHQQEYRLSYVNGTTDQFAESGGFSEVSQVPASPFEEIEREQRTPSEIQSDYRLHAKLIVARHSMQWRKDDTPPEKRDSLYYAQRYAALFKDLHWDIPVPWNVSSIMWDTKDEIGRIRLGEDLYAEKVSILEGKTPEEHYLKHWGCKEDHWRFWSKQNTKGITQIAM